MGVVTLIYDHHAGRIAERLTELQHLHLDRVVTTTHVHLDAHRCLEVILLRGPARTIRDLADSLIGTKGVETGRLVLASAMPIPDRAPGRNARSPASGPRHERGSPPASPTDPTEGPQAAAHRFAPALRRLWSRERSRSPGGCSAALRMPRAPCSRRRTASAPPRARPASVGRATRRLPVQTSIARPGSFPRTRRRPGRVTSARTGCGRPVTPGG